MCCFTAGNRWTTFPCSNLFRSILWRISRRVAWCANQGRSENYKSIIMPPPAVYVSTWTADSTTQLVILTISMCTSVSRGLVTLVLTFPPGNNCSRWQTIDCFLPHHPQITVVGVFGALIQHLMFPQMHIAGIVPLLPISGPTSVVGRIPHQPSQCYVRGPL